MFITALYHDLHTSGVYATEPILGMNSSSRFMRSDFHYPKSIFTRESFEEEYRTIKQDEPFVLMSETQTEWIIISIFHAYTEGSDLNQ